MIKAAIICSILLVASNAGLGQTTSSGPFRVTLLGTGTPNPTIERFGPSTLVEAGSVRLLVDAGRGVVQRLHQLGRGSSDVLFLTHLHSDHVVGIPDLLLTGWVTEGRNTALHVYGPQGTAEMMSHLRQAFSFDIGFRVSDDKRPALGSEVDAHEYKEGVVYEANGVRVTAFTVDHAPIEPAFGFRIDYAGHSAVISGDTRFSEHLIAMAAGADLLVHEVAGRQNPALTQANDSVLAHHTTPDQAGTVFTRVHPKLAVYSHIVGNLTDEQLIQRTRQTYAGPLVVGRDLMAFEIGEGVVVIDDATKAAAPSTSVSK